MNYATLLKPEIAAQLPAYQSVEADKDGILIIVLPSGYKVPLADIIRVESCPA